MNQSWEGYDANGWADSNTWTPTAIEQALQALGVSQTQLGQSPPQPMGWNAGKGGGKQKAPQVIPPHHALETQKREEDMARRQAELQAKRQEEVELREQHRAALVVRKVIQKVKLARPDNIDELRIELETVQAQHMMFMGAIATKVAEEADKALLDAQTKVAAEAERQIEEERRQLEEEMQRREEEARAEAMAEEATSEVSEIESKVIHAEELALPLTAESSEESPEGLLEAANVTEEAITSAQTDLNLCTASMKEKWSSLSKKKGSSATSTLGPQYRSLHARLTTCRRTLNKVLETTRAMKEKVGRKAAAIKKEREQKEAFNRADADGDGKLKGEEVSAYVLRVFDMELNEEQVNKILSKVAGSDSGVTYTKLTHLHRVVGLMRSEIKERAKKEEEVRWKAELEEAMTAHKAVINGIGQMLTEATKDVGALREHFAPLYNQKGTEDGARMIALAASADEKMAPALEKLEQAKKKLADTEAEMHTDLPEDVQGKASQEVLRYKKTECGKLQKRVAVLQGRFNELSTKAEQIRGNSERLSFLALQQFRTSVVMATRALMAEESRTIEEIFAHICGDSEQTLRCERFDEFIRSLENVSVEVSQISPLFQHIAEGKTSISLEKFSEFMQLLYKVTKTTMLTEGLAISSKVARRLNVGEVLQALEGPALEERVGVLRMRCRSKKNGDEGWATMSGNQGTKFLEPLDSSSVP